MTELKEIVWLLNGSVESPVSELYYIENERKKLIKSVEIVYKIMAQVLKHKFERSSKKNHQSIFIIFVEIFIYTISLGKVVMFGINKVEE